MTALPCGDAPNHGDAFCIVVSHYNARPADELVRLLDELTALVPPVDRAGHPLFGCVIKVVVNAALPERLELPARFADIEVQYRENSGFNIGSWQHGWQTSPGHQHYLFLQDECRVRRPDALQQYWTLLDKEPFTLVGESLQLWRGWSAFNRLWPEAAEKIRQMAADRHIDLGSTASHLQTLALAASGPTLERLGGFLLADDKVEAIATEVVFSRKAVALGIGLRQSAWRPFEYFSHDQWAETRARSQTLAWNLARLRWHLTWGWR